MLVGKARSAVAVYRTLGIREVGSILREKAGMWWRLGEPFDVRKAIGRPAEVARLDDCLFALDDPVVNAGLRYLLLSGKYEAPERDLVCRYLDPALPLIEFGAALGVVSCLANRRLTDPSRHVVVEANPAMLPVLRRNRERNGCRFTVIHRAIAYDAATVAFGADPDPLAGRLASPGQGTAIVDTTTLTRIVDAHGFSTCTLVCDIEGTEIDLVAREASTLGSRVTMLIVEVHEQFRGAAACRGMLDRLADLGFELLARQHDTLALRNVALDEGRGRRGKRSEQRVSNE